MHGNTGARFLVGYGRISNSDRYANTQSGEMNVRLT